MPGDLSQKTPRDSEREKPNLRKGRKTTGTEKGEDSPLSFGRKKKKVLPDRAVDWLFPFHSEGKGVMEQWKKRRLDDTEAEKTRLVQPARQGRIGSIQETRPHRLGGKTNVWLCCRKGAGKRSKTI